MLATVVFERHAWTKERKRERNEQQCKEMNKRKYKNGKRTTWKNLALNLDLFFHLEEEDRIESFLSLSPFRNAHLPWFVSFYSRSPFLSNNRTWNLDTKKGERRQTSSSSLIERSIDAAARKWNHSWDIAFRRDGINEQSSKAWERNSLNEISVHSLTLLFSSVDMSNRCRRLLKREEKSASVAYLLE